MKGFALNSIKAVAVVAGIVFWFMPLHTAVQLFICIGSLLVLIISSIISGSLDDENTGYWPE